MDMILAHHHKEGEDGDTTLPEYFPDEWFDNLAMRNKRRMTASDALLMNQDESSGDNTTVRHAYLGAYTPKILIEYDGVPNEIVNRIFSFVEYRNVKHPRSVCWRWYWFVGERVFEPLKRVLKSHDSYVNSVMSDTELEEFLFGRSSARGIHPNVQTWINSPLLNSMQSMRLAPPHWNIYGRSKYHKVLNTILPECDSVRYLDLSLNDLAAVDTTSLKSICHPGDLLHNDGFVPLPPNLETLSFNRHHFSGTFLSSDPFIGGVQEQDASCYDFIIKEDLQSEKKFATIYFNEERIKLVGHSMVKSPYKSIKSLHLNSIQLRSNGIGMIAFTDYLPNLTSLSLASVYIGDGNVSVEHAILNSHRLMAKLVNLSIGMRDCGAALSHQDIPISACLVQQLLDKCQSLRTLTVGSLSPYSNVVKLRSNNLTHLNISFGLTSAEHTFSVSIAMPSLESLVIMSLLVSSLEYIHLGWNGSCSGMIVPKSDSLIQCHSTMERLTNLKVWLYGPRYTVTSTTKSTSPSCMDMRDEHFPSLTKLHINLGSMISTTNQSTDAIVPPRIRLNLSKLEMLKFATSSDPLLNIDFNDVCLPSLKRLVMKAPRIVLTRILQSKLYSKSKWLEEISLSLSSQTPSELALHHFNLGDVVVSDLFATAESKIQATLLSEMRFKNILPDNLCIYTCRHVTLLSIVLNDCVSVNFVDKESFIVTSSGESIYVAPTLLDVLMSKRAALSMPFLLDMEVAQMKRDISKDTPKKVVIYHRMLATLSITCGTIPILMLPEEGDGYSKFNNSLHTLSMTGPYEPGVCKKWMSAFTSLASLELNVSGRLRSGLISSPSVRNLKISADCSFGKDRKIAIDTPNLISLAFEQTDVNGMMEGNFPSMDVRMCAPKCDFVKGHSLLKSMVRVCRSRDLKFSKTK